MNTAKIILTVLLFAYNSNAQEGPAIFKRFQSCGDRYSGYKKQCFSLPIEDFMGYKQNECVEYKNQLPVSQMMFGKCCNECRTVEQELLVTTVKLPQENGFEMEPKAEIIRLKSGCSCA